MRGVPYKRTKYQVWCYQCLEVVFESDTKFLAEKEKKRHSYHICEIRRTLSPGKAKG